MLTLCLDIGGTKIAAGLADPAGTLVHTAQRPTPAYGGAEQVWAAVAEMIADALGVAGGAVGGVGIASAGPIDLHSGRVSPINIGSWGGFPLRDRVAAASGSRSASAGAPAAVRPRAAASAATTRSVTISWVSQRRSWRPSLVPLAGSAAARGPSRSRASAASTSSTATATPATVATTRSATMRAASRREEEPGNRLRPLMSRSPSPPANRPTDPRNRPEPGPTTARAPARPAGSHRKPAWPCPGRVARRRARAGRSTPRCPRG